MIRVENINTLMSLACFFVLQLFFFFFNTSVKFDISPVFFFVCFFGSVFLRDLSTILVTVLDFPVTR